MARATSSSSPPEADTYRDFATTELAPTTVLVESDRCPVPPAEIAAAQQKLRAVKGVAGVTPPVQTSRNGCVAAVDVVLSGDPLKKSALDIVPRMRNAVANVAPGVTALVGGTSAINYDIDNANQRDDLPKNAGQTAQRAAAVPKAAPARANAAKPKAIASLYARVRQVVWVLEATLVLEPALDAVLDDIVSGGGDALAGQRSE